jgi:hypothetical protein
MIGEEAFSIHESVVEFVMLILGMCSAFRRNFCFYCGRAASTVENLARRI